MNDNLIPLIALGIAVLTFVTSQWAMRKAADAGTVGQLERRVAELERKLSDSQEENLKLMRKVLRMDNS